MATLTTPSLRANNQEDKKMEQINRKIKDKLIGVLLRVYPKNRMLVKIALAGRFRLQKLIVFW